MRVNYLHYPYDVESQQYFHDLLVSDRYKHFLHHLKVDNPLVNKSRILTTLHDNNKYKFKDFASYNWKNQVRTLF